MIHSANIQSEQGLRARPTHQRVFPAAATLQDIPIKAPVLPLCSTALHRVPRRLIYTHDALAELS
jgi:hypothetical protein